MADILAAVFSKVLVANRGEIAVRVIRALDELGIASVAVYSEADRDAQHVKRAGEAYLLGPGPAAESYLNVDKIMEVIEASGAEAVHPGYGFLAENAAFAKRLEDADITFIGPPASAIEAMGSKTRARELMQKAGVPIVPGVTKPVPDVAAAATFFTGSVVPGTIGTPAACISSRALVFDPIASMALAGGPMNVIPSSSRRRANAAFSARNP